MKKRFLFAVMAVACLALAGSAVANQVIEGGTLEDPIEYEWGYTDDIVVIGTGELSPLGGSPDPNQGRIIGHAWLGGPDAVITVELGIGKPGFDRNTMSGYVSYYSAQGSLVLREDDAYGFKTVGEVTVNGDLNIGGGEDGNGSLFIPVGSVTALSGINVGLGMSAEGLISVEGGSFTIGSTSVMKLGYSEDPATTGVVPIGNGTIAISGGSMTAPSGSSIIVGALGNGRLAVSGSAITAIDIDSVDVSDKGVVAFTIDAGTTSPGVKTINSAGHFYLADGSIIDMDFSNQGVETILSNYDEAATERVVSLITSPDLKWNETGYNVVLSPEDVPGWEMSETSNTLQLKYLGGTGDDLIVNTGTEISPTAIAEGSYRNIYIGYGLENETPIVVDGHASITTDVACTSDTYMALGDDCDASLTIGSGGSLNVFAGNLAVGTGSGADATITLNDDANLNVMYALQMSNADDAQTLVSGSAELNINDSATVAAQFLIVGGSDDPAPACSVNQAGGSVALRSDLNIGRNSETGAEGSSYTISGSGTLEVEGTINVGFDNEIASIASSMTVDGSNAMVMAGNLRLATYCTLRFIIDDGPDYTGGFTPIDLSDNQGGYGFFHAQYIGDDVDPDNSSIIEMAFAPGTESLVAALPTGDRARWFEVIRIYDETQLKWTVNDITSNGVDHVYGFSYDADKWDVIEVEREDGYINLLGYTQYASLRFTYTPEGSLPIPTADAGPDQTGIKGGTIVTLDGSGSSVTEGRSIASYTWEWNDGYSHRIVDSAPTTQTYFSVGSHVVTLTVTSDIGEIDTDTVLIEIPSAHIEGDIDYDDAVNLTDFVILRNNFGQKDPDMP